MKKAFLQLLHQYVRHRLSEVQQKKLDAWIDSLSTPAQENEISWSAEARAARFEKIKSAINGVRVDSSVREVNFRFWLKAAAGVVLLVATSYMVLRFTAPTPQELTGTRTRVEKRILSDGTIVWLKPQSVLEYVETAGGPRHARLRGAGFFEVAKDASRPFIIACGDVAITVLGTSFSLHAGSDSVELKLLTGMVTMASAIYPEVRVAPHERVVYTAAEGIKKYSLQPQQVVQAMDDTEYNMHFVNAKFGEVVERLSQKFEIPITVLNHEIESCHVNLDVTDQSLQGSLEMLAAILHVTYEIRRDEILISGSGCKP